MRSTTFEFFTPEAYYTSDSAYFVDDMVQCSVVSGLALDLHTLGPHISCDPKVVLGESDCSVICFPLKREEQGLEPKAVESCPTTFTGGSSLWPLAYRGWWFVP